MQSERKESPTGCCVQGHSGEKDVLPCCSQSHDFKEMENSEQFLEQEQGGFWWEVLHWQ